MKFKNKKSLQALFPALRSLKRNIFLSIIGLYIFPHISHLLNHRVTIYFEDTDDALNKVNSLQTVVLGVKNIFLLMVSHLENKHFVTIFLRF